MYIQELWRYPVKSLAGEQLQEVELTLHGMLGNRVVHVRDARGRVVTSRTKPHLLGLHGTWDVIHRQSPTAAEAVRRAAGARAHLVRYDGLERFDVLPLLVATDGAIAQLGVDHRRLRPNIVLAGVDGLAERQWPGRRLRLGEAIIEVAQVRGRCVMTTYDPDTQEQDLTVLRRLVEEFDGRMALDCAVIQGGRLTVGAPVILL